MTVDIIFPTYIFRKQCDLDLNELEKKCWEFKNKVPSTKRSNVDGYQGYGFYDEGLFEEVKTLIPILDDKKMEVLPFNDTENKNSIYPTFWVNINPPGAWNQIHNHAPYHGVFLSGVFYIKTPKDCGNLQLFDPRLNICNSQDMNYYNEGNIYQEYVPEENLLLIFPSWIYHMVQPNKSNENRISIAFNLSVSG